MMRLSLGLLAGCAAASAASAAVPDTMRAFAADKYTSDFKSILVQTIPTPSPKAGEVLIQVLSSSVNPVDYKIIEAPLFPLTFPATLGFDAAGVVAAVGDGCTRLKVGDKVWADLGFNMKAYAEYATAPESIVGLAPTGVSMLEAATIPLVGLTGYEVFVTYGGAPWPASANKTVLISAGQGGTGIAGIQLAKAWGAQTVITAASTENIPLMKQIGADVVVDFTKEDIWDVVGDNTVDLVYENLGLPGTANKGLAKVRSGGQFTYIAGDAPTDKKDGVTVQFFLTDSSDYKFLDAIKEVVDAGKYQAIVDNTYGLTDVSKAFIQLSTTDVIGKLAIDITK